jgi:dynein heavy chain
VYSEELEKAIRTAATQRRLAADDSFVVSVVRLAEVLAIRHCVFVMGPAGSGKTEVWRTLAAACDVQHRPVTVRDLNPKVGL